jgi:hypothetical protein
LSLPYYSWTGHRWDKRIETITEEELFRDDSLLSARALPLLLGHPQTGRYQNNKEGLLVGHTFDSFVREDGQLFMPVVADDIRGVQLIESAIAGGQLAEISPGYSIERLDKGEDYFYQIGRKYDHLALLAPGTGRGGQTLALRTDSDDSDDIAIADKTYFVFERRESVKIRIDGKEFDVEDAELAIAINGLTSRADGLVAENSRLEGEVAGIKTRLDAAENSRPTEDAIAQDVAGRLDAWALCLPTFREDKADFAPDFKLSASEIKRAYLALKHPDLKLDGKDAAFVEGVWEALKPAAKTEDDVVIERTDSLLGVLKGSPPDKSDKDSRLQKVRDRYESAYQQGGNN